MRCLQAASLAALFLLLPGAAAATCDVVDPANPENDCDEDGFTIRQGDCNDDGTSCLAGSCDPAGGPYVFHCLCGLRRGAHLNPAAPELCDGANNNCDVANLVDEGLAVDADADGVRACGSCNAPVAGACDCDDTRSAVRPGLAETCDALDNDCNGLTDERDGAGNPLRSACYSGPAGTDNVGPCHGGFDSCNATVPGTPSFTGCQGELLPASPPAGPELLCDGVDEDCDGTADDGLIADADGDGVRACGSCGAPAAPACDCNDANGAIRPGAAESCDAIDQDCDGQVNDVADRPCFEGANVTAATFAGACPGASCAPRGECRAGVQSCLAAGSWSACGGGLVLPAGPPAQPEALCDGRDEDCDGAVDDGLVVDADADGSRACGTCGAQAAPNCDCNDGAAGIRPGATEICDLIDQDCDGATNDVPDRRCFEGANVTAATFSGACPGAGCSPRGACRAGTQACQLNGTYAACGGALVLPTQDPALPEAICNGVDDDCEGVIDDGFDLDGDGARSCAGCGFLGAGCDCDDADPANRPGNAELCDNRDNDCDGLIDEGFDADGDGFQSCQGCAVNPCDCNDADFEVYPGAPERCDCLDQDCDGAPWNGFADADGDGVPQCAGPGIECNDSGPNGGRQHGAFCARAALTESCDALDNDCDGLTDERNAQGDPLRRACYDGPAGSIGLGLCVGGLMSCNANVPGVESFGACTGQVVPTNPPADPETACNQLDDDCDGAADDGFDADRDGRPSCALCPGLPGCDCNDADPAVFPGATELCDAVDQNCDGSPNDVADAPCFEGAFVTADTHTGECPGPDCAPRGECRLGVRSCQPDGTLSACGGSLVLPSGDPAQPEALCDGRDEDCDGVVDDGSFDADGDGVTTCGGDCDDDNPAIFPGALEICDGLDNDCSGVADGVETACYTGAGGTPGVGPCLPGRSACEQGVAVGECVGQVLPVPESCNLIDDDCDGTADEDFDLDLDGFPDCASCPGLTAAQCDCDDQDRFNLPGGRELCDCSDNDCNGQIDENGACTGAPCHDFDGDGLTNCEGDCNDHDTQVSPIRPEIFGNGKDDDCDGAIDEDVDEDRDGVSTGQGDCDDRFAAIHPGAEEVCDGFDNDCDGRIDEGFDEDGDFATTCVGDCDDRDPARSPFRLELCGNGIDDDCDGLVDEETDSDGDGVTTCEGDCNDYNAGVHGAAGDVPAAMEVCDGQDNDCNGRADDGFDLDGDRVPTCLGDCDDTDPDVNPRQYEIPGNGIDDNCDGRIDEGDVDEDGDGFTPNCGDCNDGNPAVSPHVEERCDRIDNDCDSYVDALPDRADLCATCFDADGDGLTNCDGDCDDTSAVVYPGAEERCDLLDNDCDGQVDLDAQGFTVCNGGGGAGGGGAGGGGGGGAGGAGGAGGESGEPPAAAEREQQTVEIGCGCESAGGSGEGLLLLGGLAALLGASGQRRRGRSGPGSRAPVGGGFFRRSGALGGSAVLVAGSLLLALLVACSSSLTAPEVADGGAGSGSAGSGGAGGTGGSGGGSGGDAGGGGEPPCPGFPPIVHAEWLIPGSSIPFAVPPSFQVTEVDGASGLLLDDPASELLAFVLRRDLPPDVDPADPRAAELVAVRELSALDTLAGAPAVESRTERFSRSFDDSFGRGGYSSAESIVLAAPSSAFALRNRLLASLAGVDLAALGSLPAAPADATRTTEHVARVLVQRSRLGLVIVAVVTPAARYPVNQTSMGDLTNGTHLGAEGFSLVPSCEPKEVPELQSDLLFVVDSSGSMAEEQAALASAAVGLYDALVASGIDFRLGVVTTDGEVLRGGGFTTELASFQNAVRVGVNGNGLEMGLEFGLRAIQAGRTATDPARALRPGAGLVVVFFSDEESTNLRPVEEYASAYRDAGAVCFAIVGPRPYGCQLVGLGSARPGVTYIDVATATGGSAGSICNPNLAETIENIVLGALGAASRSPLAERAVSGSLHVQLAGGNRPRSRLDGFDYDPASNTVLFFGTIPPAGSSFEVAYQYFFRFQ